jgi:hypothetical protein
LSAIASGCSPKFCAMVARRVSAISFTAAEYLSSVDLNEIHSHPLGWGKNAMLYLVGQDLDTTSFS